MTRKELEDHKAVASSMEWCDLAATIMGLEQELYELQKYLTKQEINKYNKLIDLYSKEKAIRINRQTGSPSLFGYMYGEDYITSWNDE